MPVIRLSPNQITNIVHFFEVLASIATVVGVIGLYIVYLQLEAQKKDSLQNVQNQIYERMVDIDKFFIEHPDARAYIYSDLRAKDTAAIAIACVDKGCADPRVIEPAAAELMLDFFSLVMLSREQLIQIPVTLAGAGATIEEQKQLQKIKIDTITFNNCMLGNMDDDTGEPHKPSDDEINTTKFTALDDWLSYMKDIYICSPALRDRLRAKQSWYLKQEVFSFVKCSELELHKRMLRLDKTNPNYDANEALRCDKVTSP